MAFLSGGLFRLKKLGDVIVWTCQGSIWHHTVSSPRKAGIDIIGFIVNIWEPMEGTDFTVCKQVISQGFNSKMYLGTL